MHILISYATTEGQTRKIARFAMSHLTAAGHSVELLNLADADTLEPATIDAAILMASVHAGRYQPDLARFASQNAKVLEAIPTLFASVSLSAAGDDPEDWAGLEACVAAFQKDTGWTPGTIAHVAGAFRFSEYNWFVTWAMRWIASRKHSEGGTGGDHEYTDWSAWAATLDDWVAKADART